MAFKLKSYFSFTVFLLTAVLSVCFFIFYPAACYTEQRALPAELRQRLEASYTQEQIDSLENYLKSADIRGLPVDGLLKRISEGAAKKAAYEKLISVLDARTKILEAGYTIVWKKLRAGGKAADVKASINAASGLVERGFGEDEWSVFLYLPQSEKDTRTIDEILTRASLYRDLSDKGYEKQENLRIAAELNGVDLQSAEKITGLLLKNRVPGADEIIKRGIREKRKIGWFKNELKLPAREEAVREVEDVKRPER